MKIAIIVPMEIEAKFYREALNFDRKEMFGSTVFEHFSVNGHDVYLGLSGIGKVNAAMNLASLLAKEKIDLVLMTGSAGSLQRDLRQGDLILANEFKYHDADNRQAGNYVYGQIPQEPAAYVLGSDARRQFLSFISEKKVKYKEGLIVTGDSFIASSEQKQTILTHFPDALGVEMEGAAFAQVAEHFKVPLIALRAISDNGDESANEDFEEFVAKAGKNAAEILIDYLKAM
ncbi:MAG: 5'-methylthioadenosine/adenosylhomocysteine nucleosidase [Lactobacillus sp.]|nr:5'-methylthioadenosine/adenosylhomocysteine nucleosidase [Lactobacillus sp.]